MATTTEKASANGTRNRISMALPSMDVRTMEIRLVGDSPLICHNWSQKARQMIKDKQGKKAKEAKTARDPEQEYKDSLYPHPDGGFGFPATAFKAAASDAVTFVDSIRWKKEVRGALHVVGDLVKLTGEPRQREDMVRIGQGVADIRYRAEFPDWYCDLLIRYNASFLSEEQIVHLFNTAGFAVGVGDWRPMKDGSFGMFHVARGDE